VPFPTMKYLLPSLAPLKPEVAADFATNTPGKAVLQSLTRRSLHSLDLSAGASMAMALFCQGMPHSTAMLDVNEYRAMRESRIVDFNPGGFFVGTDGGMTGANPEAVCLRNSTAVSQYLGAWCSNNNRNDLEFAQVASARQWAQSFMDEYQEAGTSDFDYADRVVRRSSGGSEEGF